jgi:hypothetical protein
MKLNNNEAMIMWADKGNSLVIIPIKQYDTKIQDFIQFPNPNKGLHEKLPIPSQKRHKQRQDTKWRYINTNPSALTIKGFIKIHKPEHPNRPVNWRNAPAYNLATLFT